MFFLFKIIVFIVTFMKIGQCNHFSPCKTDNSACFDSAFASAFNKMMTEDNSLGIGTSDPLRIDLIEGNLTVIKYKLFDSTVKGYKNCSIENIKSNLNTLTLHFDLDCPGFEKTGKYEISGRLIALPVEGKGDFRLTTGRYLIEVNSELKKVQDNGKTYFAIKNINLKNQAIEPIIFDFKNLFNGQKDLSDAVHKFANENWKEVAELIQDPVFYAHLKQLVIHFNKYLKAALLDEILTA